MFATIAFSLLGLITLIIMRDGMHSRFFRRSKTKKTLKKIAQHIVFYQWEAAKQELDQFPEKIDKEVILLRSQVLRGTERYQDALKAIDFALLTFGDELILHAEKARILLALGRHQEAFAVFQKARTLLRTETELLAFGQSALGIENYDDAWEIIAPLLPQTQNGHLLITAGDIHLGKKDFAKAISYYSQALKLENNLLTITKLGHAYRRFGNLQEAEKLFLQVLEKDAGDITATLGLGACYQERGQYLKALLLYQTGKAWEKKDPSILYEAGLLAIHTHRYTHAAHYFSHLIEALGETAKLLTYYGYCQEKIKNWEKAEETYGRLVVLHPQCFNGFLALAWLFGVGLSSKISCETALSYAYRAVELNPSPLSWEIVSACEARFGQYEKAHRIQEHLASLETDPKERNRHLEAMRQLRKKLPLENYHIIKTLVA